MGVVNIHKVPDQFDPSKWPVHGRESFRRKGPMGYHGVRPPGRRLIHMRPSTHSLSADIADYFV